MLGRMGSLSNHLMRGKRPPKGAGMRGRTKAVGRMMDTKAFGCTDNPQSVPTLWVERPGQTLATRYNSLRHGAHKDDTSVCPARRTGVVLGPDEEASQGGR